LNPHRAPETVPTASRLPWHPLDQVPPAGIDKATPQALNKAIPQGLGGPPAFPDDRGSSVHAGGCSRPRRKWHGYRVPLFLAVLSLAMKRQTPLALRPPPQSSAAARRTSTRSTGLPVGEFASFPQGSTGASSSNTRRVLLSPATPTMPSASTSTKHGCHRPRPEQRQGAYGPLVSPQLVRQLQHKLPAHVGDEVHEDWNGEEPIPFGKWLRAEGLPLLASSPRMQTKAERKLAPASRRRSRQGRIPHRILTPP